MNNLKCEKIVKSLENTGTDKITSSVRILKTYADIFSLLIPNLTNECFIKRIFPESLKIASITSIFKRRDAKINFKLYTYMYSTIIFKNH